MTYVIDYFHSDEVQINQHCFLETLILQASLNMQKTLPVSARDLALFQSKEVPPQHGVKALDGGDADAADAVELRGLIDSLSRIDPSGFQSVSHRFPLAPLQVVDDLLARLIFRFRHESAENSRN